MKKSVAIQLITLLLIAIIVVISCSGEDKASYTSPEETVNAYLDSLENMDFVAILDCVIPEAVTDEIRKDAEEESAVTKNMMEESGLSFSITNRKFDVISQNSDNATISISFNMATIRSQDIYVGSMSKTYKERMSGTLTMAKIDDNWLLVEIPDVSGDSFDRHFTELSMLGVEGQQASYPFEIIVGEECILILGIVNHEAQETSYHIKVTIEGIKVGELGSLTLADDEEAEEQIGFVPQDVGSVQELELLLYRNGEGEPYQTITLWVDVVDG